MSILVTGAGGFLGLYIVEQLLARGHRVRALARHKYAALDRSGVEPIQADIRDERALCVALEGVETVFHTAAVAGIWGPWQHFYSINTLGTKTLLAACKRQGVRKFVFTSSPSVTFDGHDQRRVDETAPYPQKWLAHYPHSKALAEQAVLEAASQGLLTCALRPHLIWGPRDGHLVPRLLDRARRGRLRQVGDGSNLVDMVYVENAAEAHLQAADALEDGAPVVGQPYFISQGEPVNCWDWINEILALAGLEPVRKRVARDTATRIGASLEAVYRICRIRREPPMTRFLAAQLATSHYFDIGRARRDFNYVPRVSTAEGMRRLGESLAVDP